MSEPHEGAPRSPDRAVVAMFCRRPRRVNLLSRETTGSGLASVSCPDPEEREDRSPHGRRTSPREAGVGL